MPSSKQLSKLHLLDDSEPFCLLNLIKFKHKAKYADGREGQLIGAKANAVYVKEQRKHLHEVGGEVLLVGNLAELIIGEMETEKWDLFAIVTYPNKSALRSFSNNSEWAKSNEHLVAGPVGQVLNSKKILNI